MKPLLQLGLNQQLSLTPQLQQAIRLLQMSTLDLAQEIQQAVESNPLLESSPQEKPEALPHVAINHEPEGDWQWEDIYQHKRMDFQEAPEPSEPLFVSTTSLQDHLLWQLNVSHLSDTDRYIAEAIIEAMDEDGFLSESLVDIQLGLKDIPVELDEIEAVRHRMQRLDPLGCASLDLCDCLLVQLSTFACKEPFRKTLSALIKNDLDLLAEHNYRTLKKKYSLSDTMLSDMLAIIQQLHPKPGSQIEVTATPYITPDLSIKKEQGQWHVMLNQQNLPRLSINNHYAQLANTTSSKKDIQYIKNNLQEARWFMKSIQNRQTTLLKVAQCIMEHQVAFLEEGDIGMKPLVLNDIAVGLDMHESTISRVTTQKFIHTPRGTYELKYFFSSHVRTNDGGERSSTAIKAMIKQLIAEEDSCKPLSDNKIVTLMAEKGIHVARRTIAKYRETMGIASSSARKSVGR